MADWKEMPRPGIMQILRRYCIALWCVEYPDGQSSRARPISNFAAGQRSCGNLIARNSS